MAINPPSDLMMDVARAADPQAYRLAAERLKSISASTAPVGADADTGTGFVSFSDSLASGVRINPQGANTVNPAYRKFEAFMLQSFVQSMFTSDTTATFGKGIAGEYWKSMMSEAMANKMADTGGVGVARMLEEQAAHKVRAENASTLVLGGMIDDMGQGLNTDAISKDIVHGFERQLIQKQLGNNENEDRARG